MVVLGHSYLYLDLQEIEPLIERSRIPPPSPNLMNLIHTMAGEYRKIAKKLRFGQIDYARVIPFCRAFDLVQVSVFPRQALARLGIGFLTILWSSVEVRALGCDWTGPIPLPVMTQYMIAEIDLNLDKIPDLFWQVEGVPSGNTDYFVTVTSQSEFIGPPKKSAKLEPNQLIDPLTFVPYRKEPWMSWLVVYGVGLVNVCEDQGGECYLFTGDGGEFRNLTVGLAAVRLKTADGMHYGWLKFTRDCPFVYLPFQLDSFALHPVPNAPIRAGVVPTPDLSITRTGDLLQISWHPAWRDYRLESSPSLDPSATWSTVAGVVDNQIAISMQSLPSTGYFRLTKIP